MTLACLLHNIVILGGVRNAHKLAMIQCSPPCNCSPDRDVRSGLADYAYLPSLDRGALPILQADSARPAP